jgi:hypothetical protein
MQVVLLHSLIPDPAALASLGPWLGLIALGLFHGLNPGMGWLFAVALALQRQRPTQLLTATGYIALGHLLSLLVVMTALFLAGAFLPLQWVRLAAGSVLLVFGLYRVVLYYRHPRWVGMNVGGRDLIAWSFLMATAHGAGLMLAPVVLALTDRVMSSGVAGDLGEHGMFLSRADAPTWWLLGLLVHTVVMLTAMLVAATVVYYRVGLAFLRRGWINLDLLWAGSLVLAGVATLVWAILA